MSIARTKSMGSDTISEHIEIDGGTIEGVDHFTYIGSLFQTNGRVDKEVYSRMNKARSAFSRLWPKVWGV